jgi:hypothetical protein
MSVVVVVVISQHLLNVFVQLANKRGLKKIGNLKKQICSQRPTVMLLRVCVASETCLPSRYPATVP